jgi:hypothetical protein
MKPAAINSISYPFIISGICLVFSIIVYLASCLLFVMQGLPFNHVIQNNIPALPFTFAISYFGVRWFYNEIAFDKDKK